MEKKQKTKMVKYRSVEDGVWNEVDRTMYWGCCDCSLIHKVSFGVHAGRVFMKLVRDKKMTQAARKEVGIAASLTKHLLDSIKEALE